MLEIPPQHILAHGTTDPLADARLQQSMLAQSGANLAVTMPQSSDDANLAWEVIEGETMLFDNPVGCLPPLDNLESFCPGEDSLYWRVLIRPVSRPRTPVWTYIAPQNQLPLGARRIGASWP